MVPRVRLPVRSDRVGQHVDRAVSLVAARYGDASLSLADVAEGVGLSRGHLSRLLHRSAGCHFYDLLARTRVRAAQVLLRATGLRIKEIAARTGYAHVSHLDRQFRRLRGITPGAYRTRCRRRAAPETP